MVETANVPPSVVLVCKNAAVKSSLPVRSHPGYDIEKLEVLPSHIHTPSPRSVFISDGKVIVTVHVLPDLLNCTS